MLFVCILKQCNPLKSSQQASLQGIRVLLQGQQLPNQLPSYKSIHNQMALNPPWSAQCSAPCQVYHITLCQAHHGFHHGRQPGKCKVVGSLLPTDPRAIPVLKDCGMSWVPWSHAIVPQYQRSRHSQAPSCMKRYWRHGWNGSQDSGRSFKFEPCSIVGLLQQLANPHHPGHLWAC